MRTEQAKTNFLDRINKMRAPGIDSPYEDLEKQLNQKKKDNDDLREMQGNQEHDSDPNG